MWTYRLSVRGDDAFYELEDECGGRVDFGVAKGDPLVNKSILLSIGA